MEQDNWTMWAFGVLEAEYYALQADQHREEQIAGRIQQIHRNTQSEGRR